MVAFSAMSLQERAVRMFIGASGVPRASGDAPVARKATLGLAIVANEAVNELWKGRQDEIKHCCAPNPIDKQEVYVLVLHPTACDSTLSSA